MERQAATLWSAAVEQQTPESPLGVQIAQVQLTPHWRGREKKVETDEEAAGPRDAYDLTKPNVDERMLSLYADTGRIVSASGGSVITSRDSLAQGIHYFWHNIGMNMHEPKWIWDEMLVDVL